MPGAQRSGSVRSARRLLSELRIKKMPEEEISLKERFKGEILPALQARLGLETIMAVPRLEKVVVNVGIGRIHGSGPMVEYIIKNLEAITGQRPVKTAARASIAGFKVREGAAVGLKVTLRGERMFDFVNRLINLALPRERDFEGVPSRFDGRGNFTLGLREHIIFPESIYETADKIFGLEVTFVTTAKDDGSAKALLEALGLPFKKERSG